MTTERELLEQAVTTLLAALAFDEARQNGASPAVLAELRDHWVGDAESIVDQAEELGLFDYEGMEDDDDLDMDDDSFESDDDLDDDDHQGADDDE